MAPVKAVLEGAAGLETAMVEVVAERLDACIDGLGIEGRPGSLKLTLGAVHPDAVPTGGNIGVRLAESPE